MTRIVKRNTMKEFSQKDCFICSASLLFEEERVRKISCFNKRLRRRRIICMTDFLRAPRRLFREEDSAWQIAYVLRDDCFAKKDLRDRLLMLHDDCSVKKNLHDRLLMGREILTRRN
jgi:hypothetical protein